MDDAAIYLVWSNERHLWFRVNGAGDTGDVWAACRFTGAEAEKACSRQTWLEGDRPPAVAVLAPEHGRDRLALTPDEIREVPRLMRQRVTQATADAVTARRALSHRARQDELDAAYDRIDALLDEIPDAVGGA